MEWGLVPTSQALGGSKQVQREQHLVNPLLNKQGSHPTSTQCTRPLGNTLIPSVQDVLCAETPSALASGAHVHVVPLFASWFCSGRHWAAPFPAGAVASRPGILLLEPHLAVTAGTEDTYCDWLLAYMVTTGGCFLVWTELGPSGNQMPWLHSELQIKDSTFCLMGYKL